MNAQIPINGTTGGKMKAQMGIVQTAVIIGVAVIILTSTVVIIGRTGNTEEVLQVSRGLKFQNALEAAPAYVDAALGYAVYQACFDALADGETTVEGKDVGERLNAYMKRGFTFGGEAVALPIIEKVDLEVGETGIRARITGKASIERAARGVEPVKTRYVKEDSGWVYQERLRLLKDVTIEKSVPTPCGAFLAEIGSLQTKVAGLGIESVLGGLKKTEERPGSSEEVCGDFFEEQKEASEAAAAAVEETVKEMVAGIVPDQPKFSLQGEGDVHISLSFVEEAVPVKEGVMCRLSVKNSEATIQRSFSGGTAPYTSVYPIQRSDGVLAFEPLVAQVVTKITAEPTEETE